MQETWVQSLGQEYLLEKEMATHTSVLAWRIPRTEESTVVVYSPWGCKSVKHDWATNTDIFKFSHNLFLVWCCEIVILCNENLLWAKLKEILLFNIIPTVINIFTLLWGWALFAGYLVQTIKTFNIGKGKTVQTVKRPVVARASGEGRGTSGWSPEDFQGWWEHSIRCWLFGTQGGPRRQKPSMKGKQGTQRGFCTWEGAPPPRVPPAQLQNLLVSEASLFCCCFYIFTLEYGWLTVVWYFQANSEGTQAHCCCLVTSQVRLFATPWAAAHQAKSLI